MASLLTCCGERNVIQSSLLKKKEGLVLVIRFLYLSASKIFRYWSPQFSYLFQGSGFTGFWGHRCKRREMMELLKVFWVVIHSETVNETEFPEILLLLFETVRFRFVLSENLVKYNSVFMLTIQYTPTPVLFYQFV